jgi:hypothetical protein
VRNRRLLAVVDESKLRRIMRRMLDPEEFLSDHGIRALSRHHRDAPYVFYDGPREHAVRYVPGDSDSGMFGGNSNWRGPVWIPVNVLLIRAMLHLYTYYGNSFTIECPTGSGRQMTLFEVARELSDRVTSIFRRDETGRRPVFGGTRTFQEDPHWRDHILFYEYFHGDNGAGIGASHQTGWTGMVSALIALFGALSPEQALSDVGSVFDILAASGTMAETGIDGRAWKAALH